MKIDHALINYPDWIIRKSTDLVDIAFANVQNTINIMQTRSEIIELVKLLLSYRPRCALEIGTAHGGTLYLITKCASHDATIISIDLPGGKWGGGYTVERSHLYKIFASIDQSMHCILGDSHDQSSMDELLGILDGRKLEFLMIDGDHSAIGTMEDYDMYSPLVSRCGVIVLHDISAFDPEYFENSPGDCEAYKVWTTIKDGHDYMEFVDMRGYGGIGVLFPGGLPLSLRRLI